MFCGERKEKGERESNVGGKAEEGGRRERERRRVRERGSTYKADAVVGKCVENLQNEDHSKE